MGPPPFGSGNHRYSWHRRILSSRFNGATAFRQWKPDFQPLHCGDCPEASMGPPPFGSGNQIFNPFTAAIAPNAFRQWKPRHRQSQSCAYPGFNGATAFQRWKRTWLVSMYHCPKVLQWGHRLSAVETAICARTRISTRGIVRLPPQIPLGPVAGSSQLNTHFVVCSRSVARGVTGHLHHWTSRKTPACLPPIILSPPPCGAVRGRFPR
jgi:hypothetical protein